MTIFNLRPNQRVAVLIDGASLYSMSKQMNFEIDFKTLRAKLDDACDLHSVTYFTALHPRPEVHSPVRKLVDWMKHNNYRVVSKPLREITDPVTGRTRVKGSVIAEMSFEIAKMSRAVEHLVVISGDGDLAYAVEQAAASGDARVTVISSQEAMSDDLLRTGARFIDLGEVRDDIAKRSLKPAMPTMPEAAPVAFVAPVIEHRPITLTRLDDEAEIMAAAVAQDSRDLEGKVREAWSLPASHGEAKVVRSVQRGFTVERRSLSFRERVQKPLLDLRHAS